MQSYELTIVISGKATPVKKKQAQEIVEKLVKINKGKVVKTDDWGEIPLAYKIAKNESGNFLHFHLELNPEIIKGIDNKLRLEEEVIRYLLIKKDLRIEG